MNKLTMIFCVVCLFIGVVVVSSNAIATTILPIYADDRGFTDLSLYDSSLRWGTTTVDVEYGVAHFIIEIDQTAARSVYGVQGFYIHNFLFMSDITFGLSNIETINPAQPWITRTPGANQFSYDINLWAYDTPPTTSPSFNSMQVIINNLPANATDYNFLVINSFLLLVYGYASPMDISLRFPDNTIEGLPNTLKLYSSVSGGPVPPPVPEPSTMLLLGAGLLGFSGYGGKRLFKK